MKIFKQIKNSLTTVDVNEFGNKSFTIKFNEKWTTKRFLFREKLIEFYNFNEINGLIQISAYRDSQHQFDIIRELELIQKINDKAKIIDVSIYKAIAYADYYVTSQTIQYMFVIGEQNNKLIISLTLSANNEKAVLEKYYYKFKEIVSSITIRN
jgi:hypothetical protein